LGKWLELKLEPDPEPKFLTSWSRSRTKIDRLRKTEFIYNFFSRHTGNKLKYRSQSRIILSFLSWCFITVLSIQEVGTTSSRSSQMLSSVRRLAAASVASSGPASSSILELIGEQQRQEASIQQTISEALASISETDGQKSRSNITAEVSLLYTACLLSPFTLCSDLDRALQTNAGSRSSLNCEGGTESGLSHYHACGSRCKAISVINRYRYKLKKI
jgi:hypothetical protein